MISPPRKSRKRALWLLVAGGFLLIVLGLVWVWANSRDLPPPAVEDLIPPRTVVPPEENGFGHFVKAGEALVWPEAGGEDRDIAAKMLPHNAEALRLLHAGLVCEVCVNPEEGSYEAVGASGKFAKLGLLLGAEARARSAAGEREAALHAVLDHLRFAALLRREPGCLLVFLQAESVLDGGLAEARRLANDAQVSDSELAALLAAIRAVPTAETSLRRALMGEFVMGEDLMKRLAIQLKAGLGGDMHPGLRWLLGESPVGPLLLRYWIHPNRTRKLLADHTRAMIRDLPQPLEAAAAIHPVPAQSNFAMFAKPNAWGENYFAISRGMVGSPRAYRALSEQRRAGSLLVVALRSFEKRAGRLPAALDELVPDYLPAVPASPIDGRPFRYTPAKRLVHSTDDISLADPASGPHDFHDEADVFRLGPPPTDSGSED